MKSVIVTKENVPACKGSSHIVPTLLFTQCWHWISYDESHHQSKETDDETGQFASWNFERKGLSMNITQFNFRKVSAFEHAQSALLHCWEITPLPIHLGLGSIDSGFSTIHTLFSNQHSTIQPKLMLLILHLRKAGDSIIYSSISGGGQRFWDSIKTKFCMPAWNALSF